VSRDRNIGVGVARRCRESLGLTLDAPLADVVLAIEQARVPVAVLDLGERVAGAYLVPERRPVAFVNARDFPQRKRFTAAHELGHHVLGHANRTDDARSLSDFSRDPKEVQANSFAAEFLMPRPATERWAEEHLDGPVTLETVVRFAMDFGVSALAACIRLETARVLRDTALRDRLHAEIEAGEHKHLPDLFGLTPPQDTFAGLDRDVMRLPPALKETALGRYLDGALSLNELAGASGCSPDAMGAALAAAGLARASALPASA
jgi:Zn-dependent peptidase ImmA (M78 family)